MLPMRVMEDLNNTQRMLKLYTGQVLVKSKKCKRRALKGSKRATCDKSKKQKKYSSFLFCPCQM